MKLYFVRHTSAADVAPSDAQRPLTRQGEEEARVIGVALAGMSVQPSRIFSSPLLRARQTASIIGRQMKFTGTIGALDELANGASTPALLGALPADGELILVGHMPSLAEHLVSITDAGATSDCAFGKGSIACVELHGKTGKLQWLKHLQQLS